MSILTFALFVVAGLTSSATSLYAILVALGGLGFIILLVMASIAIVVYLARTKPSDVGVWQRSIAPILAMVTMIAILVAVMVNLDLITGGGLLSVLAILTPIAAIVLGVIVGLVVKAKRPEIYQNIGTRE